MLRPQFLASRRGKIFAMLHTPAASSGRAVLCVPPFAEEMNKSRKMLTDLAAALAERGVAMLMPDFYGTGDSEGDFGDSDLDIWLDDLACSMEWSERSGWHVTSLLGARLGALIGASFTNRTGARFDSSVLWQPVTSGSRFLTQFLRLRVAASMMSDRGAETVDQLRGELRAGQTVEIAGYALAPQLARQVDELDLGQLMAASMGVVHWMELVRGADAELPAASRRIIEQKRDAGVDIAAHTIVGEPFWSSVEIVRNAALVARTAELLCLTQ